MGKELKSKRSQYGRSIYESPIILKFDMVDLHELWWNTTVGLTKQDSSKTLDSLHAM